MELKKSTETKTNVVIQLSGDDIVNLLISAGYLPEPQNAASISKYLQCEVDWSNLRINIDDGNYVCVEYEDITTSN